MSAQLWSSVIRGLKEPPPAPAKACDATSVRRPIAGEVFINCREAAGSKDAAAAIRGGHSVLVVRGAFGEDACAALRAEASWEARAPEREAELGTGKVRVPVARLSAPGRDAAAAALRRALKETHVVVPALLPSLFPGGSPLDGGDVVFTSNEPAVNCYLPGGEFAPHEDGMALTVLVVLSDERLFAGGGTAFWSPDQRPTFVGVDRWDPAEVLVPPTGSALVFTGGVRHAALPVTDGERTVFVASFSGARGVRPGEHRAEGGE